MLAEMASTGEKSSIKDFGSFSAKSSFERESSPSPERLLPASLSSSSFSERSESSSASLKYGRKKIL